jgi:hypothetical protein
MNEKIMNLAEKFAGSFSRRKFFDSLALGSGAVFLMAGLSGPKSKVGKKGRRSKKCCYAATGELQSCEEGNQGCPPGTSLGSSVEQCDQCPPVYP